jgi:putative ABC transport system permease protein
VLHTKGKINGLLAGILMMIALYSINIRIMGKPNVSVVNVETLLSPFKKPIGLYILVLFVAILIIKLLLDAFLKTDMGLALRATGDNAKMIRSLGSNTDTTIIIGVSLSNGLVAVSGALFAQDGGYADTTMGVGMIVVGLASVIIGEAIFGTRTIFIATLAVIFGSILYRIVVAFALRVPWLESSDLKLITALIVIIALVLPTLQRTWKQKNLARKRSLELSTISAADQGGER